MKNLFFVFLIIPFFVFGQSNTPNMYEVVNIKVKRGMEDKFEAAVKSHNEKFHTDSLYQAFLTYNISGPTGGTYTWIMGPTNWGAMDTRPDEGAHNDDWKNVDQYVESYSSPSYWSYSEKLSHWVEGSNNDKRLIWAYNLER
jgi:hypothetical protein